MFTQVRDQKRRVESVKHLCIDRHLAYRECKRPPYWLVSVGAGHNGDRHTPTV
jgi:hypothetical protein